MPPWRRLVWTTGFPQSPRETQATCESPGWTKLNKPHWNVYYRSSTDGGKSWSGETRLSTFVTGYSYISADSFRFPFGDYFDITIDYLEHTQACWG